MKKQHFIILAVLMIVLPIFSSCELLGLSNNSKQQENYRYQLEALQKQQEANAKAQQEYYENLAKGLNEYMQAQAEYNQQLQIQAAQEAERARQEQESNITYN
jgi:hypothetical protein